MQFCNIITGYKKGKLTIPRIIIVKPMAFFYKNCSLNNRIQPITTNKFVRPLNEKAVDKVNFLNEQIYITKELIVSKITIIRFLFKNRLNISFIEFSLIL